MRIYRAPQLELEIQEVELPMRNTLDLFLGANTGNNPGRQNSDSAPPIRSTRNSQSFADISADWMQFIAAEHLQPFSVASQISSITESQENKAKTTDEVAPLIISASDLPLQTYESIGRTVRDLTVDPTKYLTDELGSQSPRGTSQAQLPLIKTDISNRTETSLRLATVGSKATEYQPATESDNGCDIQIEGQLTALNSVQDPACNEGNDTKPKSIDKLPSAEVVNEVLNSPLVPTNPSSTEKQSTAPQNCCIISPISGNLQFAEIAGPGSGKSDSSANIEVVNIDAVGSSHDIQVQGTSEASDVTSATHSDAAPQLPVSSRESHIEPLLDTSAIDQRQFDAQATPPSKSHSHLNLPNDPAAANIAPDLISRTTPIKSPLPVDTGGATYGEVSIIEGTTGPGVGDTNLAVTQLKSIGFFGETPYRMDRSRKWESESPMNSSADSPIVIGTTSTSSQSVVGQSSSSSKIGLPRAVRDVGTAIATNVTRTLGDNIMTIELDHCELGIVRLTATLEHGSLKIGIQTQQQRSALFLLSHKESLQQLLHESGLARTQCHITWQPESDFDRQQHSDQTLQYDRDEDLFESSKQQRRQSEAERLELNLIL